MPTDLSDLFPPHPALDAPTLEEVATWDEETLVHAVRIYREAIAASERDPLRSGFVPEHWHKAKGLMDEDGVDHLTLFGGNRSGKTSVAAWMVVNALVHNPGTRIICWAQNEKVSNWQQQSAIYAMLPPEWRRKQKDKVTKVNYSLANGFTDNNFILPNGSHCIFMFYTQFVQDPSCVEGYELGWKGKWKEIAPYTNIGTWFDEYLGDPALMETMEARLSTRSAKSLNTFTPIHFYTETVRYILEGATARESVEVTEEDFPRDLFPGIAGTAVPVVQEGKRPNARIMYFHSKWNLFNDFDRFKRDLVGKSKAFILMKAFGVPTKVSAQKFPKFSRPVNVIPLDSLPDSGVTRYHIVDPAGDKPWFMAWVCVNEDGDHFFYREWPSFDDWGPWAEWKDGKWAAGEAATGECCGLGFESYKQIIEETEKGEEIFERLIDPRMGAASMPGREEKTSIISEMADIGIVFAPAPGLQEQEGIQRIQQLMDYDLNRDLSAMNRPRFYVTENCGNLVRAISSYDTPAGKVDLRHPWKDPIDVIRYAAVSDLDHVDMNKVRTISPSVGGY